MKLEWTLMPSRNEWVLHATDWDEQWPGQATGSMCAMLRLDADTGMWIGSVWERGNACSQHPIQPTAHVNDAKAIAEIILRMTG